MRVYEKEKENGEKWFYNGKWVEDGGPFEQFIHNTRYTWADQTMDHHEYYMIVSRGSNRYDGTNEFIETEELTGSELAIRLVQKEIAKRILEFYTPSPQKNAATNKTSIILNDEMGFVIFICIFIYFYFYKIEI